MLYLSLLQIQASHFIFGQVCGVRPSYSKGGKKYPTCGLTCKKNYEASGGSSSTGGPSPSGILGLFKNLNLGRNSGSTGSSSSTASSIPTSKPGMCVVSFTRLRYATTYFLFYISNFYRFVVLSQAIPREEKVTPRVVLAVGTR